MTGNELINNETRFLLYQTEDGRIKIETRMQNQTVWLTLNQMAELYGVDKSGISRHLKNIYSTGELSRKSTVAKIATVQYEGSREVKRDIEYYNLDAIISVGYRVNSILGTKFRIWATKHLREYLIKGFVMDDERLKNSGGGNYFEEMLAGIRDIRSSEKVFWRKVLDIYATSIDYDRSNPITRDFFAQVQNKMHWAAHGHTVAEIIFQRADSKEQNMGLRSWQADKIRKHDTEIAKNYLQEDELDILNRIVTAYLEFAELQALNQRVMYMKDWKDQLDKFLTISGREVLNSSGMISHQEALDKVHQEYEKFHKKILEKPSKAEIDFVEFEKEIKKIENKKTDP